MPCRPPRIAVGPGGAALLVGALATLAAACDGPGNSGAFTTDPRLVEAVPWQNGVLPHFDAKSMQAIVPGVAEYPPIELGFPDPGSQRTDCTKVGQYEFAKGWFADFELTRHGTDPNETGIAGGWASYDDLTIFSFHTPGDATWYPDLKGTFYSEWGLPAVHMPGPSCDGTPNDWVLHFRGGLFRKWGAGISHAFTDPVGLYRDDPFSDSKDPAYDELLPVKLAGDITTTPLDSVGLPTHAANGDAYKQSHDFFDVSKYEGLAFWARRGPEGSGQSFVILTDKFTSDRLARENQKFCRRYKECYTRCLSGSPCAPEDPTTASSVYRCFDPSQTSDHKLPALPLEIDSLRDQMYPRCGPSACSSPDTFKDDDFDGKACTPYVFPSGDESGEYCFNPGQDPPPAGRDERCQDGWQTTIQLSPNWQFYALPWSGFGQVGFGKKAPYMDLKSIDVLAFGATMGWADIYLDNITLYRRKKN